jgi:hypothetical protein
MPDVPDDPIAVSAATGSAAATNRSGPQDAISAAAGSGAKPGVSGLDQDAGMRSVRESERRCDRYRSGPHQRAGPQGG